MIGLRENERKILRTLEGLGGRRSVQDVARVTGLDVAAVMRSSLTLSDRGLLLVEEMRRAVAKLMPEGVSYGRDGLPERRALEAMVKAGGRMPASEIPRMVHVPESMAPIIMGWLRRKGWAKVVNVDGTSLLKAEKECPEEGEDEVLLRSMGERGAAYVDELGALADSLDELIKRRLVEVSDEVTRELVLTDAGKGALKEESVEEGVSILTHQYITSGAWRTARPKRYNIMAPVTATWPGKPQPYLAFLDDLKRRLVGLGFKEMRGPIVELAFYNCDALYMPQDHPAREIHDLYYIEEPKNGEIAVPEVLERVRRTHEDGWRTGSKGWSYSYSLTEARRLLLRSHTTAISARMLLNEGLEVPGKYYSVARCFRPDVVDRTHLTEFNQVEGIVLGERLGLQDLLGILATFAVEIAGATKLRFAPDYFPFTEPSIELNAYKEGYGWVEFGGSGIFRPELTKPLGIKVPVLAWGLGADRLYMMKAKIDDIRTLFTKDLDYLRRKELI